MNLRTLRDWTDDELETVLASARTVYEDARERYFDIERERTRRHPPVYPTCALCDGRLIGGHCDTPDCPNWHGCPF